MFKASEVTRNGTKGTYTKAVGPLPGQESIGLGYRYQGVVVSSGGNGYYYPVADLLRFVEDNGRGYVESLRKLSLPPAYTRFDESACGGAFDGFNVTSDADPGL